MDKRILQRKSGKLIAAAAAATAGLVGWGTQHADASLVIDLRATGISHDGGNTVLPVSDATGKTVIAAQGDRVYFAVVARISGTNATQLTGNFDSSIPATDTKNDETLQIVTGSFQSTGLLKGNYDPANVGPAQGTTPPSGSGAQINPFNAAGAVNGVANDFDADGDLDIGNAGTDTSTMWSARAAAPQFVTMSKSNSLGTRLGWSAGTTFNQDVAPNSGVSEGKIIDPTSAEALIGELDWIVTGSSGTALLNFIGRPATDPGSALWFEDGSSTGKTPGTGAFLSGTPITVSVPEPASLGLLGIAGLGLLARRKKH